MSPFKNPVIDASMTVEALFPHALRYVVHRANIEDIDATTKDHAIEIDADGEGTLPDTVIRRTLDHSFLPEIQRSALASFQDYNRSRYDNLLCYYATRNGEFFTSCVGNNGTLDRTFTGAQKGNPDLDNNDTNIVNDASGDGDFVAIDDVGKRLVVADEDGTVLINAIIYEVTDADTLILGSYRVGDNTTAFVGGIATIYHTTLELLYSSTCSKGGGQEVSDNGAEMIDAYEDCLFLTSTVRAIITEIKGVDVFDIAGWTATTLTNPTDFEVYRIFDPVITLNAPTIPAAPATATEDIPMSARLLENVVLALAGALTGEIKIAELLDQRIP